MFNELKTLIKHSSVYGMAEFLRKGIGFIMIPIYTRYLTPADYGLLELLDLTLNVTAILVGLGIGSTLIRYYHIFDDLKDKQEVFTTALTFIFILSLVILGISEIFSTSISKFISGSTEYFKYFQIIFLCLAIQNIYLVPENFLIAQKKSVLYSILSIGTLVSNLSLNIFFLVIMKMGVFGILLSMLLTKALNGSVVSAISLRQVRYSFSWEKLKKIISFGMPLMPGMIGLYIMHFSDRFFLQKYCTLSEVGIYSLGYKFGMILSILISAPVFRIWDTQRFEIAKADNGRQIIGQIFTYFSAVLIFASLVISVFIDEIIFLMAAREFHGATTVTPLIVLSYILFGMGNFFTLGIMITNKTKYIAYIQVTSAALNLLMNMIFISYYGVIGAAVATVLSFLCFALFTFLVSQKLYRVPFEYGRVSVLFLLAIIIFGVSRLIVFPLVMSLVMKSLLILGFPLTLLWGGFFYREEIIKGREVLKAVISYLRMEKNLTKMPKPIKK